jgi:ATP-dependent helicase HrpA
VPYGPVDPVHARDIFIRAGLVAGGYVSAAPFQRHNEQLQRELAQLEHKSRRHDVLVDEQAMFRFFDARIPADVHSGSRFETWRRRAEQEDPELLFMRKGDLMRAGADEVSAERFPDALEVEGAKLALRYRFDPGHPLDGVTAVVPLHLLNRLRPAGFDWLVPGLLRDKLNVLVRGLPKHLRRACVPLPETVTACLEALGERPRAQALNEALAQALRRTRGIDVPADAWDRVDLPAHLRMNFAVVDEHGEELASGRDLAALQAAHGREAQARFAPASDWERPGIRAWDDLELPERVEFRRGSERLQGHPALIDEEDGVRLTLLETADKARAANRSGIARLVRLALKDQVRALERTLTPSKPLALAYLAYGSGDQLRESLLRASIDRAVWADEAPIRDRKAFDARLQQVRARLQIVGQEYLRLAEEILSAAQALRRELDGPRGKAFKHAGQDMGRQLQALLFPGFMAAVPYARLQHYPRYLAAMRRRLEKLATWPERDEQHTRELGRWWQQWLQRADKNRKAGMDDPALDEFRWMLEEQRVSLFAQELRTPYPISYKRLEKAWSLLR